MGSKRWVAVLASICLVLSLTACREEVADDSTSDDVEFNIERQQDPGFSETLGDVNSVGAEGEPVYEEDGGVAYEIDPVTLERISGPLDIDTHEPVEEDVEGALAENEESEETIAPDLDSLEEPSESQVPNPLAVDEPEDTAVESPTQEITSETAGFTEVTEYTKLPNTGKFLEDD